MNEERGALFFLPSVFRAEKAFGDTVVLVTDEGDGRGAVEDNVSLTPIAGPLGTKVTDGFGAE
jgi:hypothetical protein